MRPLRRRLFDIDPQNPVFHTKPCPLCGQPIRVEAKGTSPTRSSRWRVTNAQDGTQHSCTLRRRPIRPDTQLTRRQRVEADAETISLGDDLEPIDLTKQLASAQPYHPFRRYDGFDSQLHQGYVRKAW